MKQVVYTCTRCGKQEKVPADNDVVPLEWAVIEYRRFHTKQVDAESQTLRTTCTTHACGDCAQATLDDIESRHGRDGETARPS